MTLPEQSGWGFDLTFRLARQPDENEPPIWAVNLLQNLGRYVFDSGNPLRHGPVVAAEELEATTGDLQPP